MMKCSSINVFSQIFRSYTYNSNFTPINETYDASVNRKNNKINMKLTIITRHNT